MSSGLSEQLLPAFGILEDFIIAMSAPFCFNHDFSTASFVAFISFSNSSLCLHCKCFLKLLVLHVFSSLPSLENSSLHKLQITFLALVAITLKNFHKILLLELIFVNHCL